MKKTRPATPETICESEQLRGFHRSTSELQVLLLSLVLLYFFIPTHAISSPDAMIATMITYAAFVLTFRYWNFKSKISRWKLAFESWGMIAFITAILWYTGLVQSPLINLYLLVIILCAITLGKLLTLLEVILIACCYALLTYKAYSIGLLETQTFTQLLAKFSPFLMVAYVTSMLATDVLSAKRNMTLLSQTDELTSLLNLQTFNLILETEIARSVRYEQPFTIVMIELDNLDMITDRYGHPAGNRLVKVIASSVIECVRTSDVLARYGKDQYIVLLTQTSAEHVRIFAERIRSAIHNTSFDVHGNRVTSTASIGIASFPDVEIAEDTVERALIALQRSKQNGRDKVTYYEADPDSPPLPA